MKIVPVVPNAAPVTGASAAPAAPVARPAARPAPSSTSSFEPASRRQAPVALAPPVKPEVRTGPVALDSTQARSAIQQVQGALVPQTLVPGAGAGDSYSPLSVNQDSVGGLHVRMQREFEGTKVFGEQRIGHLDRQGALTDVTGESAPIPPGLGDSVKLSSDQALGAALQQFGKSPDEPPQMEKVIFQDDQGNYRAGYHVELADFSGEGLAKRMNYLVDGATGEVAKSWNALGGFEMPHPAGDHGHGHGDTHGAGEQRAEGAGPGQLPRPLPFPRPAPFPMPRPAPFPVPQPSPFPMPRPAPSPFPRPTPGPGPGGDVAGKPVGGAADDQTMYSGKVDLSTSQLPNGQHVLRDGTRGKGVETRDAQNRQTDAGSVAISDNNGRFGEPGDSPRQRAAVDAQYGAQMTYDFYKDVLGRDSIDGRGERLVSNVHLGRNWVNAQWTGQQMDYGDGDGRTSGPLTTLDIAGHEITHGLTQRTAGLIYSGESGGLNEAFSDIMGTGVEWYASQKNANVKFDWSIGEDAFKAGSGGLRFMNDPTKDGRSVDHYSRYRPGMDVHFSSGIANNAFYLLANGGTNKTSRQGVAGGIGIEKSLKVFAHALTNYMAPNTNFSQARAATVRAATDLYGATSPEVQKVKDAWTAVGVR